MEIAWKIFKGHWLIGTGPWTYAEIYPNYINLIQPSYPEINLSTHIINAHNFFLQIAADSGLIGFSLLSALIFYFYKTIFKIARSDNYETAKEVGFIAVAITCFLVHNLWDVFLYTVSFLAIFTILVSIVDFQFRKQQVGGYGFSKGYLMSFKYFSFGFGAKSA